ncbi:MAG TPA: sensor histidine kinase [Ktedonobacterales bacterium]|nr:sensor histidine kinase [Ktedonobacterales bacterium]
MSKRLSALMVDQHPEGGMPSSPLLRDDEQARTISPYLLWVIWLMWLPFLIQPAMDFVQMPPSLRKVATGMGILLFLGSYLWATWQEASRLTRATSPGAGSRWRRWLPVGVMLVLNVVMPFVQGAWGLGGLIYTSASVTGRLKVRQAVLVVGGLMLLAVILGVIISVPWATVAQMLFLIPVVGATAASFSRTFQTNRELRLARKEIARLAVSEERLRFARDLHDSVKQHLFAVSMQVGAALAQAEQSSEATRSHLVEADTLISQAQQELTALIHELRPSELQQKGLPAALREYTQNWSRQHSIAVELDLVPDGKLPLAIEDAFWRIAQEALSNAARHSQASKVQLCLKSTPEQATLSIADNGRGFALDGVRQTGIGLHSMRERMAGVGGTVTIQSRPGEGTRLLACCKLV